MADKKISALTASTTPLAGTEVLPIVQGGSTVKVSVANLTAGRTVSAASLDVVSSGNPLITLRGTDGAYSSIFNIQAAGGGISLINATGGSNILSLYTNTVERFRVGSTGDATMVNGNLVVGTANKGIDFSANTHAAGMTSELLNDYEEGNWTPVLQRETGGAITASYNTQTGKYVKIGNLVTVTGFIDVASVSAQGSGPNGIIGLPYNPANNSLDAGSVARNNAFTTDVVHSCFGWSDGRILFSSNVNSNAATAVDWKAGFINFTFSYFV